MQQATPFLPAAWLRQHNSISVLNLAVVPPVVSAPCQMGRARVEGRAVVPDISMYVVLYSPLCLFTCSHHTARPSTSPRPLTSTSTQQAAINQLAFGANPSAGAGGPGAACGVCYWITPVSSSSTALSANALKFMIIDECPASVALSGGQHCKQCRVGEVRGFRPST
jgi:hypothetical protein